MQMKTQNKMRLPYRQDVVLFALLIVLGQFGYWSGTAYGQSVVSFQTEDGWTIHGTLHLPQNTGGLPVPGVVVLAEPGWVVRAIYDSEQAGDFALGRIFAKQGMAALTMDLRGTGSSLGRKRFSEFSPAELEKVKLDVRGAIKFLSAQKTIDARRIGIVAAGVSANYALLEASENPAVQALVLLSGKLSQAARDYIQARSDIPILCVAGKNDKEYFREMAEAYYLSENKDSDFLLSVDHGSVMMHHTGGLAQQITQWLVGNLKGLGTETDISFKSEDGWTLHGSLIIPDGASENSKVPGVVFVHGAMHDQETYYDLAREVVKRGMAVLTFDWRGKNREIKEGRPTYGVNLTAEERDKVYLDVKAALEFLASQKKVDSTRIGLVSATFGVGQAVHAASTDPRVRTIVMLTAYKLSAEEKKYLASNDVPIFVVASSEDTNYGGNNLSDVSREAYMASKSKYSQFLLYDDAGRGSEMLKTKPELQPMVVRWLAEKLAGSR